MESVRVVEQFSMTIGYVAKQNIPLKRPCYTKRLTPAQSSP